MDTQYYAYAARYDVQKCSILFFPEEHRLDAINRFESPAKSTRIFKTAYPGNFLHRLIRVLQQLSSMPEPDAYEVLIRRTMKSRFELPD